MVAQDREHPVVGGVLTDPLRPSAPTAEPSTVATMFDRTHRRRGGGA